MRKFSTQHNCVAEICSFYPVSINIVVIHLLLNALCDWIDSMSGTNFLVKKEIEVRMDPYFNKALPLCSSGLEHCHYAVYIK